MAARKRGRILITITLDREAADYISRRAAGIVIELKLEPATGG
ncbi:hypothetical protein [Sporomusa termitida]|nr:hypothetical protein [Sporomusa termitida]